MARVIVDVAKTVNRILGFPWSIRISLDVQVNGDHWIDFEVRTKDNREPSLEFLYLLRDVCLGHMHGTPNANDTFAHRIVGNADFGYENWEIIKDKCKLAKMASGGVEMLPGDDAEIAQTMVILIESHVEFVRLVQTIQGTP